MSKFIEFNQGAFQEGFSECLRYDFPIAFYTLKAVWKT